MRNTVRTDHVDIAYNHKSVVKGLNIAFDRAEIVSIIGPNGSGKSTVLKAIGRLLKPVKGIVLLEGRDIHSLPAKAVAKKMSILPQGPQTPDDITVRDLVSFGRSPYHTLLHNTNSNDNEIIDWALSETGTVDFAYRTVNTLSGGERQRAWIAMALAQKTEILLLDEPTTFLDLHHQFEIMELLQRLNEKHNMTVIMVIHDLNHAARFSHRVIAVKDGIIVKDGSPQEVITEATLQHVFGIKVKIMAMNHPSYNIGCDVGCKTGIVCIPYGVCR